MPAFLSAGAITLVFRLLRSHVIGVLDDVSLLASQGAQTLQQRSQWINHGHAGSAAVRLRFSNMPTPHRPMDMEFFPIVVFPAQSADLSGPESSEVGQRHGTRCPQIYAFEDCQHGEQLFERVLSLTCRTL